MQNLSPHTGERRRSRRRSSGGKGARALVARHSGSGLLSSSLPSAFVEEPEDAYADSLANLTESIAALTADVPISNAPRPKRERVKPFRFFDLPSELRIKIYEYHFASVGEVLDLESDNYKRVHKKLAILRTCRLVYKEASYVFYNTHIIRLFPIYGKFFKSKKPLLARMTKEQRACITTLELRLGPGWNRPPRGWAVNDALGLKDCTGAKQLKVFVECDPSNDIFTGFRLSDGFYEKFSRDLLNAVLEEMPWLKTVEFDANPSVKKSGAMMRNLLAAAESNACKLAWGPEKGWTDGPELEENDEKAQVSFVDFAPIGGATGHLMLHAGNHGYDGHGHTVMPMVLA